MDIHNLIDKLNAELDKLNRLKSESIDTSSFFTNNEHFNDTISEEDLHSEDNVNNVLNDSQVNNASIVQNDTYSNITPDNETKSIIVAKETGLVLAKNIFKRSIKFSLKSFLITISLSFLNLFI